MTDILCCLWKSHCPTVSIVKCWTTLCSSEVEDLRRNRNRQQPPSVTTHITPELQDQERVSESALCVPTQHIQHISPHLLPSSLWHSAPDRCAPHKYSCFFVVFFVLKTAVNLCSCNHKPLFANCVKPLQKVVVEAIFYLLLMKRWTFVRLCP